MLLLQLINSEQRREENNCIKTPDTSAQPLYNNGCNTWWSNCLLAATVASPICYEPGSIWPTIYCQVHCSNTQRGECRRSYFICHLFVNGLHLYSTFRVHWPLKVLYTTVLLSHIDIYIHTLMAGAAIQNTNLPINLGIGILLKDTLTCGREELGVKPVIYLLADDPLYLLSNNCNVQWNVFSACDFWQIFVLKCENLLLFFFPYFP